VNREAKGNYAPIHGLQMYYEIHGTGQPLVLLHGGFGGISMFEQLLPDLAQMRQVIGVELQGHGHTADIDRPLSFEQMADDVASLIEHLGLEQVDIFGFSLGGAVALQTVIRQPKVVRKAVLVSTPSRRDGWYPEVRAGLSALSVEGFAQTPVYEAYLKTSPRPEAWPTVVAKMRQLLTEDYDWAEVVAAIKAPVLLVVGDSDGIPPAHAVEFFGLLGGGKRDGDQGGLPASALAVLPATTHAGWAPPFHGIITRTQLLLPIVTEFLDSPMPDDK
jgi:pimeloyl-ACP methyl ester carboxylesterase